MIWTKMYPSVIHLSLPDLKVARLLGKVLLYMWAHNSPYKFFNYGNNLRMFSPMSGINVFLVFKCVGADELHNNIIPDNNLGMQT